MVPASNILFLVLYASLFKMSIIQHINVLAQQECRLYIFLNLLKRIIFYNAFYNARYPIITIKIQ